MSSLTILLYDFGIEKTLSDTLNLLSGVPSYNFREGKRSRMGELHTNYIYEPNSLIALS